MNKASSPSADPARNEPSQPRLESRDLGIEIDGARWQDQFWALEEARQTPSGASYAASPAAAKAGTAEPPEPESPEPELPEPAAPERRQAAPEPEVPPAPLPPGAFNRKPTPEELRANAEHKARVNALYNDRFQRSG